MTTILCLIGLFGAYKKIGDEQHPIEILLRGFAILCMIFYLVI